MNWFLVKSKASSMTEALAMYKEARAPRDYSAEYAQYHSKPQRVSERSTRNKARRKLGLAKGDPREVDHKTPISKGGSNARSNLRAVSLQTNRKKFTKTASVEYRGTTFPGYNQPTASNKKGKKKMVLVKKDGKVKLVHFGAVGYKHNYSKSAKKNYLTRSAGIKNKSGQLTKDDPFSPNHWARKVLWPSKEKADGTAKDKTASSDRDSTYKEMRKSIRGFASKQKVDPNKAMLVAGGAAYMHGMRDGVNDLDFFHDDLPDFVKAPYGRFDMDGGPGRLG